MYMMPGVILILGIAFLFLKLKRKTALWWLGHPLLLDLLVVIMMTFVHWGTFSGLMAAAFSGVLCSIATTTGRWAFGYIEKGVYYPGKFHISLENER